MRSQSVQLDKIRARTFATGFLLSAPFACARRFAYAAFKTRSKYGRYIGAAACTLSISRFAALAAAAVYCVYIVTRESRRLPEPTTV